MNTSLQIVLPLASGSQFFSPDEFFFPKPLVEMGGKTIIEYALESLKLNFPNAKFFFLVRKEDVARFSMDSVLKLCTSSDSKVISIGVPTQGALCSCLLAVDDLNLEAPLLIGNSDQVVDYPLDELIRTVDGHGASAGVLTFSSVHPRWSYVRHDDKGVVTEAAEKNVISQSAVAGLYYFKSAQIFVDAAKNLIRADDRVDGLFYIAPSLNQVILSGQKVLAVEMNASDYHSFYSPAKFKEFVEGPGRKFKSESRSTVLVIPAAGDGSRFAKAGWRHPKPFIDVAGLPMIERVLKNVRPQNSRAVVLIRSEHALANPGIVANIESETSVVRVGSLTEGTLCTVMLARHHFHDDDPILVANSDQLVDFSVDEFIADCIERDLDGSILVFRDSERNPKWSFAKVDGRGLVVEVAEKKPISDLATVGIYFFRRASDLYKATIDMIAHNDRVNDEFYTCPVYNYMIRSGARVGVFEVAFESMRGIGTPDDLRMFLNDNGMEKSMDDPA